MSNIVKKAYFVKTAIKQTPRRKRGVTNRKLNFAAKISVKSGGSFLIH